MGSATLSAQPVERARLHPRLPVLPAAVGARHIPCGLRSHRRHVRTPSPLRPSRQSGALQRHWSGDICGLEQCSAREVLSGLIQAHPLGADRALPCLVVAPPQQAGERRAKSGAAQGRRSPFMHVFQEGVAMGGIDRRGAQIPLGSLGAALRAAGRRREPSAL
eukprot:scaffold332_cov105-Isochrysis_galbana.AAC.9